MATKIAEVQAGDRSPRAGIRRRRFTVAEFLRAAEAGVFDPDERLELVEGEIVRMMTPIGPEHALVAARLLVALAEAELRGFYPYTPTSVRLGKRTLLEPDIALLPIRARKRTLPRASAPSAYPGIEEAALVIEVADASLARDLGPKAKLYAKAGAREYWVADVAGARLVVHRLSSGEGWGEVREFRPGQTVAPEAFPDLAVDLARVFGTEIESAERDLP